MPQTYLKFPIERQDKYNASIRFQPIKVIPVSQDVADSLIQAENNQKKVSESTATFDLESSITSGTLDLQAGAAEQSAFRLTKENTSGTLKVTRIPEICELYAPAGLAFNDNVNITSNALGALGGAMLGGMGQGSGIMSAIMSGLAEGGKSFLDMATSGLKSDTARVSATRAANRFLPQGAQSAVSIGLQVTSNPNQRSMFGGVNIRTFTFAFKFVPLSERESEEIHQIIKWFRKEMYPENINFGDTGIPFGYEYPNLFDIKILYNNRKLENMEILPCYLQSIQHNYNASSMTWHKDGRPTEVDVNLTFTEYRTLHKGDVINEYQRVEGEIQI